MTVDIGNKNSARFSSEAFIYKLFEGISYVDRLNSSWNLAETTGELIGMSADAENHITYLWVSSFRKCVLHCFCTFIFFVLILFVFWYEPQIVNGCEKNCYFNSSTELNHKQHLWKMV